MTLLPLTCSTCSGSGFLRRTECSRCRGQGTGVWMDDVFVYAARRFDTSTIRASRLVHMIDRLVVGGLFFFGLAGIGTFVWHTPRVSDHLFAFVATPSMMSGVLWASLFFDAYLFYRFICDLHGGSRVHRRGYRASDTAREESRGEIGTARTKDTMNAFHACTPDAIKGLERAWRLAARLQSRTVEPDHLLAALLRDRSVAAALGRLDIESKKFVDGVKRLLTRHEESAAPPEFSPDLRFVILTAYREVYDARKPFVDTIALMTALSLLATPVTELFDEFAISTKKLRDIAAWFAIQETLRARARRLRPRVLRKNRGKMDRAMTAVATPFLDLYGHDLTQIAKAGYLASCVGRDTEIDAIFRVLESGKTSVLLVGHPGTGKTKIVEGIADRIVRDEVPLVLSDKRLVSLSIPALLSGASAMGELEERMYRIMNEIARAGNILLFLDNIQNLVGVTTEGGEAFDLSHVLADGLEKGVFLAIGATTPADYTKYLERSSAVATVFQKVDVAEMTADQTVLVLEAKAGAFEYRYNVYFSYDALVRAATLARQFIPDRFLPDKAIKLIEEVAAYVQKIRGKRALVRGEDVATIVAEKTKIPVTAVTTGEKEKLLHLEERLHERIVGQDEAVRLVSRALRRARAELRDPKRPIANFLFLGPTGVGKTELAKTVADVYFGDEEAMIRLDMSEYQERSSLSRLIGTVGAPDGQFTEAVRKRPYALVLLDEIEKAHPDLLNVFLQVMDDGRITDASGRTIDCTNTIIIGTSNAGTQFIQDAVKEGRDVETVKEELMNNELRNYFRPEFLNRFDAIVVFKPLTLSEIIQITRLLLKKVEKRLEEKGMHLRVEDEAVEELARAGFDPVFGARPLRRAIQEHVDDAIAKALLEGTLGRRDVVVLGGGGEVRVEKAAAI